MACFIAVAFLIVLAFSEENANAAVEYASLSKPPEIVPNGLTETSVRIKIPLWRTGDVGDNPPSQYFVRLKDEDNGQVLRFLSFSHSAVQSKEITMALPSAVRRAIITVEPVTRETNTQMQYDVLHLGAAVSLLVGDPKTDLVVIVVPIVMGVLLLLFVAVGVYFCIKRKRNNHAESKSKNPTGDVFQPNELETRDQTTSRSLTFMDRLVGHSASSVDRLVSTSRMELAEAMESDNLEWIARSIERVKRSAAGRHLKPELKQASETKDKLKRIKKPRDAVVKMSRETLMELREYRNPPAAVHHIIRAVLLLLGTGEDITSDWLKCQRLCNTLYSPYNHGLFLRIQNFKLKFLHPEIAMRVREMLAPYSADSVNVVRDGLGLFYTWAKTMTDERLRNVDPLPKPAKGDRQNAILSDMAKLRHF